MIRRIIIINEEKCSGCGLCTYPDPTQISLSVEKGYFLVITGHDLQDLKLLLEQTEGKGARYETLYHSWSICFFFNFSLRRFVLFLVMEKMITQIAK